MNLKIKKYELSGGSNVEVIKFFEKDKDVVGSEIYFAIVEMAGEYPGGGKVAVNRNRDELFYLLDGSAEVTVNGKASFLKKGDTEKALNSDRYKMNGKGRMLVLVRDGANGSSEIADEKPICEK